MANYKEQLQQNNNELSAILETVESLPEGGEGSNTTSDKITIYNNTGKNMVIGGYTLKNGETVDIPYNFSVGIFNLVFQTALTAGSIINCTGAITATEVTNVSVTSGLGSSLAVVIGLLLITNPEANTTIEVFTQ